MTDRFVEHARELVAEHGLIDLHIDTFIPPRLWGYDPLQRHGLGILRGHFFGHLDVPRLRDSAVSAAMWSITTNPFRPADDRWLVWQENRRALQDLVDRSHGQLCIARTPQALRMLDKSSTHAVLPVVQGGNALTDCPDVDSALADGWLTRVTLVHLTDSVLGATSSPLSLRRDKALTPAGEELVAKLNRHRVFVDLAHAHRETFWQAVAAHDRDLPLIATHTGVAGVTPHWRNLDDEQIRAIADSGGVIGVIAAANFLRRPGGPRDVHMLLEHLEHAIATGGESVAALGTDLDGAIVPPLGMRDGLGHLRLVAAMLERGWHESRIRSVCIENFMQSWARLRPDDWQPRS